jgi:hypothetical protein
LPTAKQKAEAERARHDKDEASQAEDRSEVRTSSIDRGPHGSDQPSTASPEQGRESQLASTDEEMDARADLVAQGVAASIAPARAREEAEAARKRAAASDYEQNKVEARLAEILDEVAERYDATSSLVRDRQALFARRVNVQPASAGTGSGGLGSPLPDGIRRGTFVVLHTDGATLDTTGFVTRVWPAVPENDEPDSPTHRWRADLAIFPLWGSPGTVEGVAYGEGVGQFEVADDVDDDEQGRDTHDNSVNAPFRHEIR